MSRNKRSMAYATMVNMLSGIGVLITNICISFFLSPYIIRVIGVEANGFINLANNFVAYADLVVTALNAMAARFITIAYVNKDYEKANRYYNSVFWGNLIIVGVLLLPASFLIVFLEHFVAIPTDILMDVKILFAIAFLGFFLRTAAPNWDCGTYVTNRLDRANRPLIISALFRCVFLLLVFSFFVPHIWYVTLAAFIVTLFTLLVAAYNTHVLTPELRINVKKPICSLKAIKELVGSGIWSSIAIAGNTMMNSLDLLVSNIFLGATEMGVLSISKTLPGIMSTFSGTIRGVFGPEMTIAYASGNKESIRKSIVRGMKIMGVVVTIPAVGIVVMSDAMYRLWLPSQDANLLQILTSLAVFNYVFSSGIAILNNVFTAVNKVRINSIALIITGFISIGTTILVIKFTTYGIYAVAGVSSLVMILKNLFFMLPVASKLLGFKWYQFYPQVLSSVLSSILIFFVGKVVRYLVPVDSWLLFFLTSVIIAVIGLVLNMMVVLNREEREYLIAIMKRKIKL